MILHVYTYIYRLVLKMPRLKPNCIDANGDYDLVKAFGISEVEYLIKKKKTRKSSTNTYVVGKSHFYRLRNLLVRLHREDEIAAAAAARKSSKTRK